MLDMSYIWAKDNHARVDITYIVLYLNLQPRQNDKFTLSLLLCNHVKFERQYLRFSTVTYQKRFFLTTKRNIFWYLFLVIHQPLLLTALAQLTC